MYRRLFESSPGCYLILSPDLKIIEVTQAYLDATMTRKDSILGRFLFEVFPDNPDDPQASGVSNLRLSLEAVLKERLPNTMAVQKYDIRRPESEGGGFEERYWSPVNVPVLDESGQVEMIIHSVQDVTEFIRLKQMAEGFDASKARSQIEKLEADVYNRAQEIQAANQRLVEANEALQRSEASAQALSADLVAANIELEGFTYTVSHDLRGPLRTIVATSRILLDEASHSLNEEHRNMLERQVFGATRLSTLIDELLQLSRLAHTQLSMEELDLTEIAKDVAQELEDVAAQANIRFRIAEGMVARGDGRLVRLVLVNLMENAVKFSPGGGEISVSSVQQDGVRAWCVSDNGIGFDMAYADRIFRPFERLVRDDEFPGTGIGLANVKRITERHGGTAWVESQVGGGSQFYFTLC